MSSAANNPGNFANRDKEEVSEIGRKGGQSSHSGGFASMDPQKQVYVSSIISHQQHDIASKGGHAAQETGKPHHFTSEEAREAGRKGGQAKKST